jgi:cation transport ATPase
VTDIILADGVDQRALLQVAASIEAVSEHPLARAVLTRSRNEGVAVIPVEDFEALSGQGARGVVDGKPVLLGNLGLMREHRVALASGLEKQAQELNDAAKTCLCGGTRPASGRDRSGRFPQG